MGLGLCLLGGICYGIEVLFYGDLDAHNVLRESFFLPLSFFFFILGGLFIGGYVILAIIHYVFRRSPSTHNND